MDAMTDMGALDRSITDVCPEYTVRKDLVGAVKGNALVPTYVLEYLLSKYATTTDQASIDAGVDRVRTILADNYVHREEANLIQSKIREKGRYQVIDKVQVALNEKTDQYEATFENLGISRVIVDPETVRKNPKLLVTGIWCLCMLLLIGGAYLLSAPDRRGPVVRLSCLLSVILLLFASLSKLAFTHNVAELVVLHEGEDTSVILLYDRHASVLFCNGNSRMGDITADFLLSRGILRLDCMFFSDSGYTTQKSVLSLAEQIPVSTIFCPEPAKIKSAFAKQQADISFLSSAECQVSLTENISISSAATSGGTVCLLSIWDHTLSLAPSQYAASYFQRTATSEKAPDILLLAGKISSFLESLDFDLALILEEQTYALQTSGEIVPAFFGDQTSLLLRSNGQYQVVQTEMEAFQALFE